MNGMGMSLLELIEYTMLGDIVAFKLTGTARRNLGSADIYKGFCILSGRPATLVYLPSLLVPFQNKIAQGFVRMINLHT